jgi:dihydrofolate reductase
MKTILVFVSTLDGKITRWENPFVRTWSSVEDQDYFHRIWKEAGLIVMGSNTFNADPVKPSGWHLLVILTKDPAKYKEKVVPGRLEFTNESPSEIVLRFAKEKRELMLVVGGAHVATSFLKEELIDELWLTIEPKIFGKGLSFVTDERMDIELKLLTCEKVNERGTMIMKYQVIRQTHIKINKSGD